MPENPCVDRPTSPASLPLPLPGLALSSLCPALAWCHLKAGDLPQTQLSHPPCSRDLLGSVPGQTLLPSYLEGAALWVSPARAEAGGQEAGGGVSSCLLSPLGCAASPSPPSPPTQEEGARCSPTQTPRPQDPPTADSRLWKPRRTTQTLTISKSTAVTPPSFGKKGRHIILYLAPLLIALKSLFGAKT